MTRNETFEGKILMDMIELRRLVGGIQAKKTGAPFPTKSAKELIIKMRAAGDELGMVLMGALVSQHTEQLPSEKGTLCHTTSTVRFMSSDGSYMDFVGSGHGGDDKGDKAGGKASTYSQKDAVTKALCAPDMEMVDTDDEMPEITQAPKKSFNFGKGRN